METKLNLAICKIGIDEMGVMSGARKNESR